MCNYVTNKNSLVSNKEPKNTICFLIIQTQKPSFVVTIAKSHQMFTHTKLRPIASLSHHDLKLEAKLPTERAYNHKRNNIKTHRNVSLPSHLRRHCKNLWLDIQATSQLTQKASFFF